VATNKAYVGLTVVTGAVSKDRPIPLEACVIALDSAMSPLGAYSNPITPPDGYDLSLVSMHTDNAMVSSLENEGLWAEMRVTALQVEVVDRALASTLRRAIDALIVRDGERLDMSILCDDAAATQHAVEQFFPVLTKELTAHNCHWISVAGVKSLAEAEGLIRAVAWPARAHERTKAVMRYGYQMRQIIAAGVTAQRQRS